MRLTHQLGRGTKVHLLLDDEYQITTSTTFWAEHYLPDGTEISEDDWQRLVQQINERKALNKAVELLSHRDHSAKELRDKLLRTADSDAADKAVAQMLDAGYLDSNIKGQWNDDWNKSMGSQSKVFAFLLPAWGIDFVLNPNWDGESGNWAVTNPPQEYNWGGSYIHAATGTDNVKYAKDIILAMTSNQDNLLKISQDYSDFTNTKSGMAEAAKDDADFSSEFLGGQNPFVYFAPVAENIKIAPLSAYDQGCVELIQNSFSDYLQGNVDFDKAKANFETAIKERYPDITEVQWPE